MGKNTNTRQSQGKGGDGEGGGRGGNSEAQEQAVRVAKRHRSNSGRSSEPETEEDEMPSEDELSEDSGGNKRFNIVVRFAEEGGVTKMNLLKLTKELEKKCGVIKFAKVLNDGNLLIGCNDEIQVAVAKQITMIGKCKVVTVVQVGEQKLRPKRCKGVITGVTLDIKEDELNEHLKARGVEITSVKRMTRGPERKESETVLVEFEGERIPDRLYLGCMSYFVRAYIPKPMRCFKCQKFGHIAKYCKEKRRCPRCTGDHEYEECTAGTQLKCCSCGGEHSVTFGGCAVMKQEVEVQKVKVLEGKSYAEAVKAVKGKGERQGAAEERGSREIRMVRPEPPDRERVWVDKKQLVIFIAAAINATAESKSRSHRLQFVVRAAIDHLGMGGLKWEKVEAELKQQSSQETERCITP